MVVSLSLSTHPFPGTGFFDVALAPIGEYDVVVTARDLAGSESRETAHILIPAPGVTPATLPVVSQPQTTDTCPLLTDDCPLPAPTAAPQSSFILPNSSLILPTPTRSAAVSAFQSPTRPSPITNSPITNHQPPAPLFGAAALTAIAAATGLALAERKRRKEEERAQAEQVRAEAAVKNVVLETVRRVKRTVTYWRQKDKCQTGRMIAGALLIVLTDIFVGLPLAYVIVVSQGLALPADLLETFFVLPVNILGVYLIASSDCVKTNVQRK